MGSISNQAFKADVYSAVSFIRYWDSQLPATLSHRKRRRAAIIKTGQVFVLYAKVYHRKRSAVNNSLLAKDFHIWLQY